MGLTNSLKDRIKNYYEFLKQKVRTEKIKEIYLRAKTKTITALGIKKEGKEKQEKPLLLQIVISMLIPFIIFFPNIVQSIALWLLIGLILLLVIFLFLGSKFFIFSYSFIIHIIIALILIGTLLGISYILNCGPNSCLWIISTRFGTVAAYIIFFIILFYFLFLGVFTSGLGFWIAITFSTLFLYVLIPLLSPGNWYKWCKNIPLIYGSSICRPREVKIDPLKTVKIPTSGGINVKIETPSTLYAGNNYEYTFSISNIYEKPIYFEIVPSIVSSYGSNIEFFSDFQQKTFQLKPKEYYQDSFLLDKNNIKVGEGSCPWKADLIARAKGYYKTDIFGRIVEINTSLVPCAIDKPCPSEKEICGKIEMWECECIDWDKATCSKSPLKAKIKIKHNGFLIGNVSLFYSEKITKPSYGFEFTQGPLTAIVELQPNPYIASLHQYREYIGLFLTLKSNSGDIYIKNIKITPLNTIVRTIDKEKEIEIIEEIGTEIIECKNIEEILPSRKIIRGQEIGGRLCSLKPPSVKTEIRDLQTQEIKEVTNVTYPFIKEYCEKKEIKTEIPGWASQWAALYSNIDQTGLCEILLKNQSKEKQTIEKAMSSTIIIVEIEYEREENYYSLEIIPYTRTEECMKLKEKESQ